MTTNNMRIPRLDERGVALPVALLALVTVSLLVTTALVTSSTELALSNAHQDGTRGIYQAEGALEEYVAARAVAGGAQAYTRLVGAASPVSFTTAGGDAFSIYVARLHDTPILPLANGNRGRDETYSLVSQPSDGRGRSIGAMITIHREMAPFGANINSAAMVGAEELTLPGSSYTLSGIDGCTGDTLAGLTLAKGVNVTKRIKEGEVIGGVDSTDIAIADFARHILAGRTPEEVAAAADIRWGGLPGGKAYTGSLAVTHTKDISTGLNWGCPGGMVSCGTDPDSTFTPLIGIQPNPGTKVSISGSGQGFLIVLGEASFAEHFKFEGVIIVAGDVHINRGVEINGALVALSDVTLAAPSSHDDDEDELRLNGQTTISYNSCTVADATNRASAALMDLQPQQFLQPTGSWFEVVR